MAGAVAVQVAREEVFEHFESGGSSGCSVAPSRAATQQLEQPAPPTPRKEAAGEGGERHIVADARADAPRDEVTLTTESEVDNTSEASPEPPTENEGMASEQGAQSGPIVVTRHTRLAPYKPGKMTVVLDMDECLLHSKFHGPGAASEAYRQLEERPDAVNEVNSFWVALDDGDTAQVR